MHLLLTAVYEHLEGVKNTNSEHGTPYLARQHFHPKSMPMKNQTNFLFPANFQFWVNCSFRRQDNRVMLWSMIKSVGKEVPLGGVVVKNCDVYM